MPNDTERDSEPLNREFELTFEEHEGYFFVCVEGESTSPKAIDEYQSHIAAEISKRNYDRVIIKRDIPLINNSAQHCSVIYKVRAWQIRHIKFAFVDMNPEHIPSYKLALLFATSSGVQAEVFADVPTARKWLLS